MRLSPPILILSGSMMIISTAHAESGDLGQFYWNLCFSCRLVTNKFKTITKIFCFRLEANCFVARRHFIYWLLCSWQDRKQFCDQQSIEWRIFNFWGQFKTRESPSLVLSKAQHCSFKKVQNDSFRRWNLSKSGSTSLVTIYWKEEGSPMRRWERWWRRISLWKRLRFISYWQWWQWLLIKNYLDHFGLKSKIWDQCNWI